MQNQTLQNPILPRAKRRRAGILLTGWLLTLGGGLCNLTVGAVVVVIVIPLFLGCYLVWWLFTRIRSQLRGGNPPPPNHPEP